MPSADLARQIEIPRIWIASNAVALCRFFFNQEALELERRPGEAAEAQLCFEFANEAADAAELLRQP